jgi:hypothetical protein
MGGCLLFEPLSVTQINCGTNFKVVPVKFISTSLIAKNTEVSRE